MQISTESLRPNASPGLSPALIAFENTGTDMSPETAADRVLSHAPVAHDPVGHAAAALQRIACRSFHVSGAQVDVQRVLFGVVPWLKAERCDVENVSKGGVTFECRFGMVEGEAVELKLRVPGERDAVALKGHVRWSKRTRYGGYRIGIQFAPFGASLGRNPRSALEALRAIEAKHA